MPCVGLWFTGDQKNKIYHLTVVFFFLSFFFFPVRMKQALLRCAQKELQTWQATGKSISSSSEGRNATVNNKKKKNPWDLWSPWAYELPHIR